MYTIYSSEEAEPPLHPFTPSKRWIWLSTRKFQLFFLFFLRLTVFAQIAHVIREVRQFQQTPYKIDPILKAAEYLLDPSRRLPDDELYQRSLMIEPRSVILLLCPEFMKDKYLFFLTLTFQLSEKVIIVTDVFWLRSSRLSVSYPSTSTSALSSFSNQKTGDKWRTSLLPQIFSPSQCNTVKF